MTPQPPCTHDFLTEPLLSVRMRSATRLATLPEVLELLGKDEVEGFPGLQPHQQHSWHAFLVQVAAIALHRNHKSQAAQTAKTWVKWLLLLGGDAPEAWCLVVPDLRKPALLQPPLSTGDLKGWKGPKATPDEIDLLQTAKNHDVKSSRLANPRPKHWLFALLNLQTMQGFFGKGNYGIARMNGGFSNRPGIGLMDGLHLGKRFSDDVSALLRGRAKLLESHSYLPEDGLALLWTEPWTGKSSLGMEALDPYFIEVCRRVRLTEPEACGIQAWTTPTEKIRVNIEAGLTGDPWTPVDEVALTVGPAGFNYKLVSELLFQPKYNRPIAVDFAVRREDAHFHLVALVRGQGKTEGLHQRLIPVSDRTIDLSDDGQILQLGKISDGRIADAERFRTKVLKPPLLVLLQGAPVKLDFKDRHADRWIEAFEQEVDRIFFQDLFAHWRRPPEQQELAWRQLLVRLGNAQLQHAIQAAPVADSHRLRAETAAEDQFRGLLKKHEFPNSEVSRDVKPAV